MRWLDHLSLLAGPVPDLLGILAFGALAAIVLTRRLVTLARTLVLAAGSLGLVVLVGHVAGVEHRVGSTFPRSFYLWAALPVFAIAVAVSRWTKVSWPRRLAALAAVVLLLAFGADQVDAHYLYLPTVGDALGRPVQDQVVLRGAIDRPHLVLSAPTHVAEAGLGTGARLRDREDHGTVIAIRLPGSVSGFRARRAMVWLPPVWFDRHHPGLPAILVLGGEPGTPADMIRAGGAVEVADEYAAAHEGVAPILVFADANGSFLNDTECVDGPRGNSETYLVRDVRDGVVGRFGASALGSRWGIIGYSEGGTCAITVALRHPHDFGGFLDMAGELDPTVGFGPHVHAYTVRQLYGGRTAEWWRHDPPTLLRDPSTRGVLALFAAGFQDRNGTRRSELLAHLAKREGLSTEVDLVPGGHDFGMVARAMHALFATLADRLTTTPTTSSVS